MIQIPKKSSSRTPDKPNKPEKPGKVDGHSNPDTQVPGGGGNSVPGTGINNGPAITPTEIHVPSGEVLTSSVPTAAPS